MKNAEGKKHYGVILSNQTTGDYYKLKSLNDKTLKYINIVKLSNALKHSSVSIYDHFNIAGIKKYQGVIVNA